MWAELARDADEATFWRRVSDVRSAEPRRFVPFSRSASDPIPRLVYEVFQDGMLRARLRSWEDAVNLAAVASTVSLGSRFELTRSREWSERTGERQTIATWRGDSTI